MTQADMLSGQTLQERRMSHWDRCWSFRLHTSCRHHIGQQKRQARHRRNPLDRPWDWKRLQGRNLLLDMGLHFR